MRITEIKATHIEMTDGIQARIEKRLGAMEKLCKDLEPCDIAAEVGKTKKNQMKGPIFRAEFNMRVPGAFLRAERVEDDLYRAIDIAVKELRRQLKQYRRKQREK